MLVTKYVNFYKTKWLLPNSSVVKMGYAKLSMKSNQLPNLQVLKVRPKKKKIPPRRDAWAVVGYSTADQYNLLALHERLQEQGYYHRLPLSEDLEANCLCVRSIYSNLSPDHHDNSDPEMDRLLSKDIFFFADGSVIFWNMPHLERTQVLDFLRRAEGVEGEPFELGTIEDESEKIVYSASQQNAATSFSHGSIKLAPKQPDQEQALEKYAFSNAIGNV